MTAMAETPKKKSGKKAEQLELSLEEGSTPPLHVVMEDRPKLQPGDKDFDWQEEYPGEEIYVYTVPQTAKKSASGKQSPPGMTIGMAKLTEDRAPNPGEMEDAYETGGFAPMWLFLREVSSPAARRLQKKLRPAEYNEMLRGWAKFAGIELSE